MADYIDRATVVELINDEARTDLIEEWDIMQIPTADVEPVRHGHWEFISYNEIAVCSKCKRTINSGTTDDDGAPTGYTIQDFAKDFLYCPSCGAKMDGGKDEQED